jgi:hypothetical protein
MEVLFSTLNMYLKTREAFPCLNFLNRGKQKKGFTETARIHLPAEIHLPIYLCVFL